MSWSEVEGTPQKNFRKRKGFTKNCVKQGCIIFQNSRSHLKILSYWMVTWRKFHNQNPQMLRANAYNSDIQATWRPGLVWQPPPPPPRPFWNTVELPCNVLLRANHTDSHVYKKEHAVGFSYHSELIILSSFPIYPFQLHKQASSFLACCSVNHSCKNVHLKGAVFRVLSPPLKVFVLSFGWGNILSPLITPSQLFLIEERLFPLSETLFRPHFSEKRKRCVHKRGLKERKGRTLQTKII